MRKNILLACLPYIPFASPGMVLTLVELVVVTRRCDPAKLHVCFYRLGRLVNLKEKKKKVMAFVAILLCQSLLLSNSFVTNYESILLSPDTCRESAGVLG